MFDIPLPMFCHFYSMLCRWVSVGSSLPALYVTFRTKQYSQIAVFLVFDLEAPIFACLDVFESQDLLIGPQFVAMASNSHFDSTHATRPKAAPSDRSRRSRSRGRRHSSNDWQDPAAPFSAFPAQNDSFDRSAMQSDHRKFTRFDSNSQSGNSTQRTSTRSFTLKES